jgi:exopolyphosphatase/guanosine-5'-triphosphate,3'-diphosphate pyrophosphatase
MRLGILDTGSNTVNILVSGADHGMPSPVYTRKLRTRLAEQVGPDGVVAMEGRRRVITAVQQAAWEIRRAGTDTVFPYATAVIRDAPNREQVLDELEAATGIRLGTLSGEEEARLTFLAARRWLGWRAGPMLLADIGGGSLEVAYGDDRLPDIAVSLPLGAGRLTREFLRQDPPSPRAVKRLRRYVREQVHQLAVETATDTPRTAVAASKTFQQLARLAGAAPLRQGPMVTRRLHRRALRPWIHRLATLPAARRARLPGVSAHRARQILAGSIVAYEVMRGLGIESVRICPWGLREGILLREFEAHQPELGNAAWVPCPLPVVLDGGPEPPAVASPGPFPSALALLESGS